MKWVFDWKCSLYSLTVCLDSMSIFPFFFYIYCSTSLVTFCNSGIHYTSGLLDKFHTFITNTSAVRKPGQVIPSCLRMETTCTVRGKSKYARLPFGLFGGGVISLSYFVGVFLTEIVQACPLVVVFCLFVFGATVDCYVQVWGNKHSYDGHSYCLTPPQI